MRQRYGLPKGDYDRQRHQQQFVRAMAKQALSAGVVTNPIKLDKVLRAAGQAVVFNGRGHSVADFGWALRNLREDSIMMVKLEGGGVGTGSGYQGEALNEVSRGFLESVRNGTVDQFMVANPQLVNRAK